MGQALKTSTSNQEVKDFWNLEPCGTHFIDQPRNTPEFYQQYAAFRYQTEWHIPELVPFAQFADKDVLEIGLGLGTDGTQFARHGARYTGVDLTEAAVEATRLHFETLGYSGRFEVQNAEALTLEDEAFDLVYSHGVLHHTANIENTFREINRVLKPNGRIILMLYHRHSFNYYIRILGYMRLKVFFYTALRHLNLREAADGELEIHYQNYLRQGWPYFSKAEFPHHATDGAACPIAHCYSRQEVAQLLSPYFENIQFAVAHFPINKSLPRFPRSIEKAIASRIGWYLFIYGQKRS
ncbi:MAG: class I SAM-dependent methyltransferase [Ardenticatenaceae bacterium]|nr:class I SAM-dependent methyltransferase [Ardenticatenaceae bacterium]